MYDPLVVDTFVKAYPEISPAAILAGQEARSLIASEESLQAVREPEATSPRLVSGDEATEFERCRKELARVQSTHDLFEVSAASLVRLTPTKTVALFRYEPTSDALICEDSFGDTNAVLPGLLIPLGERVTGWSAANRQITTNADAYLDLRHLTALCAPPLHRMICTPLVANDRLWGALAAYTHLESGFLLTHGQVFERVAHLLVERLSAGAGQPPSESLGKQGLLVR